MKNVFNRLRFTAIFVALFFLIMPFVLFAQSTEVSGLVGLDEGLQAAARAVELNVAPGTEIAVYKISTEHEEIGNYLCDELIDFFTRSRRLVPLAREAALRVVDTEQKYQMSGLVSDASAVGIGHSLGAKVVITGTFDRYADFSQLRLRAIDVRSSAQVAAYTARIRNRDTVLTNITAPYGTAPLPQVSENVLTYLNRGKDFYAESRYDSAIYEFDRALYSDNNLFEAYLFRGYAYIEKGFYDQAIADYTQAIRIDPNYANAYYNRGNAYNGKRDFDRAIADYTQAIRINPNYAYAYTNRGNVYQDGKNDYERAIADYTQAIRIDPNSSLAYFNRGLAYYNKKDYDRTIADCTQAIRINPNVADYFNERGRAYFNKKDYDRAIADFTQAIRIDSNHEYAYFNLGSTYYNKKDYDRAIANFTQALRNNPNNESAKRWLDEARKQRGW
jgi:tetratricopeptide (TPR) repeat protein